MKKLKELWGKEKILIVLGLILVVCMIAILSVTISFFFGGDKSIYGNRLDKIDEYPITEEFKKEYIASLENDKNVESVVFDNQRRIIYIKIIFKEDTPLVDAQSKAASTLTSFSEELLSYYDIQFIITASSSENSKGFKLTGAKNASGSGLVWSNNTPLESEE